MPWCLVVPVKRLAAAKSRLTDLAGDRRADLALAFAADTVAAAISTAGVRAVVVVTDDARAERVMTRLGAEVVTDLPRAGLNPALVHGTRLASRAHPDCGVAALAADLPALRPDELAAALTSASRHPSAFVADTDGTGTTMLAARPGSMLGPAFGPMSRESHRRAGVVELSGALATLRRDVDTENDLRDALGLGVGPRTEAMVATLTRAAG